jgi:hypothetical protein
LACRSQEECAQAGHRAYAVEMAGTEFDVARALERATVDFLLESEPH